MFPKENIRYLRCRSCETLHPMKYEDYPKWVDKPCPDCGKILLTQERYDEIVDYFETPLPPPREHVNWRAESKRDMRMIWSESDGYKIGLPKEVWNLLA